MPLRAEGPRFLRVWEGLPSRSVTSVIGLFLKNRALFSVTKYLLQTSKIPHKTVKIKIVTHPRVVTHAKCLFLKKYSFPSQNRHPMRSKRSVL